MSVVNRLQSVRPAGWQGRGGAPLLRSHPLHICKASVRGPAEATPIGDQELSSISKTSSSSRRQALLLSPMAAMAAFTVGGSSGLLLLPGASTAAEAAAAPAPAAPPSPSTTSGSTSSSAAFTPFVDNDYELEVPASYTYYETPVAYVERGPQPERSPVRARFESPDGGVVITVLVRRAQTLRRTLLQLSDLSEYGPAADVAPLLMPRGAALVASASVEEPRGTRTTPLGEVELPPRTYYLYDFTTPTGLRVAMSAAAQRGNVYVCGVSAEAERWDERAREEAARVVRSFKIKTPPQVV